jgi:acyl-coenzyme A thioesterase PaaI-like protein
VGRSAGDPILEPPSNSAEMPSVPQTSTTLCGGCKGVGRCRLGVGEFAFDGRVMRAPVICRSVYHGGPGVAHGGWTAAMFDDVIGRSLGQRGARTVTASLTVDFLKPVPIDEPLVVEVRVESHSGRRWEVTSLLRLAAAEVPLARARGLWLERREGHFERHEAAMSEYRMAKFGD